VFFSRISIVLCCIFISFYRFAVNKVVQCGGKQYKGA